MIPRWQLYLHRIASLSGEGDPSSLGSAAVVGHWGRVAALDARVGALMRSHSGLAVALHGIAPTLSSSSTLLPWAGDASSDVVAKQQPSSASQARSAAGKPHSVVSTGSDNDGASYHGGGGGGGGGVARPTKVVRDSLALLGSTAAPALACLSQRRTQSLGQIEGMQLFHDSDRSGSVRSGKAFPVVMRGWLVQRFFDGCKDAAVSHLGVLSPSGGVGGGGGVAPSALTKREALQALLGIGAAAAPVADADSDDDESVLQSLPSSEPTTDTDTSSSSDDDGVGIAVAAAPSVPASATPVMPTLSSPSPVTVTGPPIPLSSSVAASVATATATGPAVVTAKAPTVHLPPVLESPVVNDTFPSAMSASQTDDSGDSDGRSSRQYSVGRPPLHSVSHDVRSNRSERSISTEHAALPRPPCMLFSAVGHLTVALRRYANRIRASLLSGHQTAACKLLYHASAFLVWSQENGGSGGDAVNANVRWVWWCGWQGGQ